MRALRLRFPSQVVLLIALFPLVGGCTTTRADRLARFELGAPHHVWLTAPETDAYKVKWVVSADESGTVPGSARIVRRGAVIGFTADDGGRVVAIAGKESFPVEGVPPDARRLIWYRQATTQSDFGLAVGHTVQALALGSLLVGALALEAWAESKDDDCEDEDEFRWRKNSRSDRRRKRRAGRPPVRRRRQPAAARGEPCPAERVRPPSDPDPVGYARAGTRG